MVEMLLVVQVLAQPLILLPDASLLLGARSVVLAMSHSLLLLLLLLLRLQALWIYSNVWSNGGGGCSASSSSFYQLVR